MPRRPWATRSFAFTFQWKGALWVAGGTADNYVYGSYDLGRSWIKSSQSLPQSCWSTNVAANVYSGVVYLICSFEHGQTQSTVGRMGQHSYMSSSPTLSTPWIAIGNSAGDGLTDGRSYFSLNHMSVPFDGVGTLMLLNGQVSTVTYDIWNTPTVTTVPLNDVWWMSATATSTGTSFQTGTNTNQLYPFTTVPSSTAFQAPWSPRSGHTTTTDAAGLTLIMVGGFDGDAVLNDVWQLSWQQSSDGIDPPLVYLLTAAAMWAPRYYATLYNVNDKLFLYGGQGSSYWDDLWSSSDYGTSWALVNSATTGDARSGVNPSIISWTSVILGGQGSVNAFNDVSVAYMS